MNKNNNLGSLLKEALDANVLQGLPVPGTGQSRYNRIAGMAAAAPDNGDDTQQAQEQIDQTREEEIQSLQQRLAELQHNNKTQDLESKIDQEAKKAEDIQAKRMADASADLSSGKDVLDKVMQQASPRNEG